MRRWILIFSLLLCGSLLRASEWVPITSNTPESPRVTVVSDVPGETVLRVEVPGYHRDTVDVEGTPHTRLLLHGSPRLLKPGDPELPFVSFSVAIPAVGVPSAEVIEAQGHVVHVGRFLPSKGSLSRSTDPSSVPWTFSGSYGLDSLYPASGADTFEPYLLRNVRGVAVAFYPMRYNPVRGELTLSSAATIRIRTTGKGGANLLPGTVPECLDFQQVYAQHFANGGSSSWAYTPVRDPGALLIITNDAFYDAVLPMVHWKRQRGVPCEVLKLSEVGSTAAQVKVAIQARYDQGGLAHVLLVGDAAQMPYPTGTAGNVVGNAADPMYALLAGGDSYPDITVSRFPAQTPDEAATMANRVIRYEKTPQASGTWYHTATGIASNEGSPTDGQRMDWLRADLLGYNYTTVDQIYDPGATSASVTASLNQGRGLINYIGHGGETYWVTTGFGVSQVYALSNGDRVPFIFDVACVNGKFNRSSGDCFAEAWLKAGTPSAPKGALGIYASSTNQDWVPPCDAQAQSVDLLVAEQSWTFGALCFNGVMKGLDMYPGTTGTQLFQQWHIFGDGSATVFTDTPTALAASHANGLPSGAMSFDVTVPGVSGATCALYDPVAHSLYGSAVTGAGGGATIALSQAPQGVSSLLLTVTAKNRVPYIATLSVGGGYLEAAASAAPTSGNWPLPVTFSGSGTGGTPPYTYQWSFGDGASSSQQNPTHTFTASGTYRPVLTVRDQAGATATDSHLEITVTAPPCTLACSASAPSAGTAGTVLYFSSSATPSAGCMGTPTYAWTFGDGSVSAQKNPSHTYAQPGTFAWTFAVTAGGQTCTKSGTLTIAPGCSVTCQASALPDSGDAPLAVRFSAAATVEHCGGAPSFAWTFGDGGSSAEQNPTHTYAEVGNYAWGLTVQADGSTCSETGTVQVVEPCTLSCEASAAPAVGVRPLTVSFAATALASHCAGEPTFSWSFGDGGTSAEPDPTHTYGTSGVFGWSLTVSAGGLTCTRTGSVEVVEPCTLSCEASAAPAGGVRPLAVSFAATALASNCAGEPTFSWSFGDGGTSAEPDPTHTFATSGIFGWSLTVSAEGLTCTRTGSVEVMEPCALICEASAAPSGGVRPLTVSFAASALASHCAGEPTFSWSFGDGGTSAEPNPTHAYDGVGTFAWTLTATAGGATCSRSGIVTVEPGIPGDADGDGTVTVGEIQIAVNMFLELVPPSRTVDCDGDGIVTVGELQKVVNAFLGLPATCRE